MLLQTYKEYDLHVSANGRFTAMGISRPCETMSALIEAVDEATKVKYKSGAALMMCGGYGGSSKSLEVVKVTRPHGHSTRKEFWYVAPDKSRGTSACLYLDTPDNRDVAAAIQKASLEIAVLRDSINVLTAMLKPFTTLEVIK